MGIDATDPERKPGYSPDGPKECRVGRSRFAVGDHKLIGLLLVGFLIVPWLPPCKQTSVIAPTRWARGSLGGPIFGFAFAPDGKTIATAHEDGRVAGCGR